MIDIESRFHEVAEYIRNNYGDKIYQGTWLSGSSTTVYPITLWNKDMTIQLDSSCRKNTAESMGRHILKEFGDMFDDFYYAAKDGSCPKELKV